MVEFFKILGQGITNRMMRNPTMQLGQDIMAGNAAQGFENFARQQYARPMQMGQSLLNTEIPMQQRLEEIAAIQDGRPRTRRMQISQGLPQGILPLIMG